MFYAANFMPLIVKIQLILGDRDMDLPRIDELQQYVKRPLASPAVVHDLSTGSAGGPGAGQPKRYLQAPSLTIRQRNPSSVRFQISRHSVNPRPVRRFGGIERQQRVP